MITATFILDLWSLLALGLRNTTITLSLLLGLVCFGLVSCGDNPVATNAATDSTAITDMVHYPQKGSMHLLTDRPPQLETPLEIFKKDITPNEYFFVRWHMPQLVSRIDIDTFRLRIGGAVSIPLALSMQDLRTRFTPDSVMALAICAGNSRSTFNPNVPGSQWKNGAMGNAWWKGVKLRDVLAMAGIRKNAVDVTFTGMDKPVLSSVPAFIKSLSAAHALSDEVLIAYEMNGEPIPMLNGYPLKLVVPGWYASYWVGALGNIDVLTHKYEGYWMTKAYRIANNDKLTEHPDSLAKETKPVTNINLHSIFVAPKHTDTVVVGKVCAMQGLAFNDGCGMERVEISTDDGKTWIPATLDAPIGKYAWQRWRCNWTPTRKGKYLLCVRATDSKGNTQPDKQWNRSGYARGFVEHITLLAQ